MVVRSLEAHATRRISPNRSQMSHRLLRFLASFPAFSRPTPDSNLGTIPQYKTPLTFFVSSRQSQPGSALPIYHQSACTATRSQFHVPTFARRYQKHIHQCNRYLKRWNHAFLGSKHLRGRVTYLVLRHVLLSLRSICRTVSRV